MNKTIAVIEDAADLATTLVMLLEAEGYVARSAPDGATGIALARELGAHVVLLDYWLPDMTGKEVAEALSADATEQAPKILLCTSASEELVRCETPWYHAYLRKPITRAHLISTLDATLAG